MKKMEKSMPIAIVAVIISIVAITSAFILKPMLVIGAGAVGTNELADDSVTSDKIVDGTIKDADLTPAGISRIATNAVGSNQIVNNSITLQDIGSDVTDAITGVSIADNSITSAKIADGTIVDEDISTAGISRIANDSVTSTKIQDETITNVDISSTAAIDLSKLATYPFGLADLAANSVDGTKIVDESVTSADIQNGAIQTTDIAAGAVTQTGQNFGTAVDTTTAVWESYENLDEARVEITTDNNPVLIVFSGVFSNNTAGGRVRIWLMIDGDNYWPTTRTGTSSYTAGEAFVLAFNGIAKLQAGSHVMQVVWCVMDSRQQGSAYNRVLDVIELKR